MNIVLPPGWPRPKGFSNAVVAEGRMVFIAGQVGWTPEERFESDDFADQTKQALLNIKALVEAAGGSTADLVRLTWYVTDKQDYLSNLRAVGAAYREVIGAHYPAMALVQVVALVEDRAKVEIEATAVIG
ncbi:MAG: RidA family protein [Alphaproteobacteria bacterium]|nr:RidA family protein [Alphaproteobacteria bacterium]